jgi:hypothetical protein
MASGAPALTREFKLADASEPIFYNVFLTDEVHTTSREDYKMAKIGFWAGIALGTVGSVMLITAPQTKKLIRKVRTMI